MSKKQDMHSKEGKPETTNGNIPCSKMYWLWDSVCKITIKKMIWGMQLQHGYLIDGWHLESGDWKCSHKEMISNTEHS